MTIKAMPHVNPADLIRSALFNELIDNVADLQSQLDALGGRAPGGTVEIKDWLPVGNVTEVRQLTIRGRNFAVPAVLNTVKFDATSVEAFLSGTDTELVIDVPGNIPDVPGDKTLTVSNPQHGSASRTVHVVAATLPLKGKVIVTDKSGSLGKIVKGSPYTFQFELDGADLEIAETFMVRPVFLNAVGATSDEWKAATAYLGTTGDQHEVTVAPSTKVTVGVIVSVPEDAQQVDMHVDFVSRHNDPQSSNSSESIPIRVGATQPDSSGAVTFQFGQQSGSDVVVGAIGSENGLQVTHGKAPIVQMIANYNVGGTYLYDALQIEAAAGAETDVWSATSFAPPKLPHAPGESETLQFKLHAPAVIPTDGVQRYLRITATRKETTDPGPLTSYYRFPIVAV